jgi:hypothetical protein
MGPLCPEQLTRGETLDEGALEEFLFPLLIRIILRLTLSSSRNHDAQKKSDH